MQIGAVMVRQREYKVRCGWAGGGDSLVLQLRYREVPSGPDWAQTQLQAQAAAWADAWA